jgi:uncharacterized protein YegP (UPF0339 family)
MTAKFEIHTDGKGEYRWRLKSANGQVIATSGEEYISKVSAQTASRRSSAMPRRPKSRSRVSDRQTQRV